MHWFPIGSYHFFIAPFPAPWNFLGVLTPSGQDGDQSQATRSHPARPKTPVYPRICVRRYLLSSSLAPRTTTLVSRCRNNARAKVARILLTQEGNGAHALERSAKAGRGTVSLCNFYWPIGRRRWVAVALSFASLSRPQARRNCVECTSWRLPGYCQRPESAESNGPSWRGNE